MIKQLVIPIYLENVAADALYLRPHGNDIDKCFIIIDWTGLFGTGHSRLSESNVIRSSIHAQLTSIFRRSAILAMTVTATVQHCCVTYEEMKRQTSVEFRTFIRNVSSIFSNRSDVSDVHCTHNKILRNYLARNRFSHKTIAPAIVQRTYVYLSIKSSIHATLSVQKIKYNDERKQIKNSPTFMHNYEVELTKILTL